jgi:hypothetical protein
MRVKVIIRRKKRAGMVGQKRRGRERKAMLL